MTTAEIDPADAGRIWQRVVYASRDLVDQLDIPSDAAEILTVVGLPLSVEPLFAAVSPTAITSIDGSRLVRLGTDFGTSICFRLPDGPVISAPDAPGLPVRHVNADLPRFAGLLLETRRTRQHFS